MESTKESPTPNNVNASPITVLIADDDPPTRLLLKAGILRWGYAVIEASDGEEAWTFVNKKESPDIIILDWMMPKLDGVSLCLRIREQLKHKPYIILLTQMSGSQNIIKGLEAGADEYLSKPFNMAELRSRLSVGVKLINNIKVLKGYFAKVDETLKTITNITAQISNVVHESSDQETGNSLSLKLEQLASLSLQLQGSLKLLMDVNSEVSGKIQGP